MAINFSSEEVGILSHFLSRMKTYWTSGETPILDIIQQKLSNCIPPQVLSEQYPLPLASPSPQPSTSTNKHLLPPSETTRNICRKTEKAQHTSEEESSRSMRDRAPRDGLSFAETSTRSSKGRVGQKKARGAQNKRVPPLCSDAHLSADQMAANWVETDPPCEDKNPDSLATHLILEFTEDTPPDQSPSLDYFLTELSGQHSFPSNLQLSGPTCNVVKWVRMLNTLGEGGDLWK